MGFGLINERPISLTTGPVGPGLSEAGGDGHEGSAALAEIWQLPGQHDAPGAFPGPEN